MARTDAARANACRDGLKLECAQAALLAISEGNWIKDDALNEGEYICHRSEDDVFWKKGAPLLEKR